MSRIQYKPIDYELETISYYTKKQQSINDEQEIMQNFTGYGIKQEELDLLFEPYFSFKQLLNETMPQLEESLVAYFTALSFTSDSFLDGFYRFIIHQEDIEMEEIVNQYFSFLFEKEEEKWTITSFVQTIETYDMTDKEKLFFIHFYLNYKIEWQKINAFLKKGAAILQKHYQVIHPDYQEKVNIILSDDNLLNKINQTLHSKELVQDNVELYIGIIQFNRLSVILKQSIQYVHLGYLFYILVTLKKQHIQQSQTVINRLKVLADPSRFKILQLLTNQEYYAQELAKLLNLTTATLSHHMEILTGEGLVEVVLNEQNKKNIYFRLNQVEMHQLIEDWKRSFSL